MGRRRLAEWVWIACVTAGSALAAEHPDPLFEPDASFPDPAVYKRDAVVKLAHIAAQMIDAAGYSCHTISGVRALPFRNAFVFACDRNRYEYQFRDFGGHIEITIDGRVIAFQ